MIVPLRLLLGVAALLLVSVVAPAQAQAISGEAVYAKRCASCHDQLNPRIPTKESLQKMPATRIVRALDTGAMMSIAFTMHRDERLAVASYLGTSVTVAGPTPSAYCTDRSIRLAASPAVAWNGWSPGHRQRALPIAGGGWTPRRAGQESQAEVGVRLRRRRVGLRAADRARRPSVRRERRRHRARDARRHRVLEVGVPGERPGARGAARGAGERPARADVRRHDRLVLRPRRRNWAGNCGRSSSRRTIRRV